MTLAQFAAANPQRIHTYFSLANRAYLRELARCHRQLRDKLSNGEPGSNLRLLFDNREAARDAWEKSIFPDRSKIVA